MKSSLLLLVLLSAAVLAQEDRDVSIQWNPGCVTPDCQLVNLVYFKAVGSNDTVHVFYSTIGSLAILMYKTAKDSEATVNWANLLNDTQVNGAITFNGSAPQDIGAYVFPTIYEFNDEQGKADMRINADNASYWVLHKTADLTWSKFNQTGNSSGFLTAGNFVFSVRFPGKKSDRGKQLPHMLLNDQSGAVDFEFDGVKVAFVRSKFGVEVLTASAAGTSSAELKSLQTIDDEYTPGTFRIWNWVLRDAQEVAHSFFQWKPIFYYFRVRSLENSTITRQDYPVKRKVNDYPYSVANVVFKPTDFNAVNVSFGLEGDEKDGYFYNATSYSVWTFTHGFGEPPKESMSFVVTLVIIVGFGLPAVVIVVGLIVMVAKKLRKPRESYEEVN